jgi:hypothetical protein
MHRPGRFFRDGIVEEAAVDHKLKFSDEDARKQRTEAYANPMMDKAAADLTPSPASRDASLREGDDSRF